MKNYNKINVLKRKGGYIVRISNPMNKEDFKFKTKTEAKKYADKRRIEILKYLKVHK